MFPSPQAKDNQFKAVRRQMADQGIDALIARGSSAVRGDGAAFRFLTDFLNVKTFCWFESFLNKVGDELSVL